ncbi:MAG: FAD-binding protein [Pseudomonadota bacterium]
MEPRDEADLADIVARANGPLSVRGGNTRGMAAPGTALSLAGLSGITLYEPGALTLVARSGTPVADIEAALAAEGQRLAFEPMDHRTLLGTDGVPTIGGVLAANISGPRRIAVGAARDFALGVRFVDGTGQIVKNGGRVMKNVTGYDLVKLQCGAKGALGVLTEVSLKVLPRPETSASLRVPAADAAAAVDVLSRALGTPYEVTGAAWDGADALVRIEGFEASVAYRLDQLQAALGGAPAAVDWDGVRNAATFADTPGDVWRISVRPSAAPGVVAALPAGAQCRLDWGGGLIWVLCAPGTDLRAALGHLSGFAVRVRGAGPVPMDPPQPEPLARIEAGLRERFDPKGLFRPTLAEV